MTKEELIEFLQNNLELKAKNHTDYEGKVVAVELTVLIEGNYVTDVWIGDLS